jgi:hypothetical protein
MENRQTADGGVVVPQALGAFGAPDSLRPAGEGIGA